MAGCYNLKFFNFDTWLLLPAETESELSPESLFPTVTPNRLREHSHQSDPVAILNMWCAGTRPYRHGTHSITTPTTGTNGIRAHLSQVIRTFDMLKYDGCDREGFTAFFNSDRRPPVEHTSRDSNFSRLVYGANFATHFSNLQHSGTTKWGWFVKGGRRLDTTPTSCTEKNRTRNRPILPEKENSTIKNFHFDIDFTFLDVFNVSDFNRLFFFLDKGCRVIIIRWDLPVLQTTKEANVLSELDNFPSFEIINKNMFFVCLCWLQNLDSCTYIMQVAPVELTRLQNKCLLWCSLTVAVWLQ